MIHRYMAMAVGVLIIALAAIAWRKWRKSSRTDVRWSPWLPTMLLGFVCLQGAFGAWTVTMKLQPVIVSTHLLLGMSLLALLAWLSARQNSSPILAQSALPLRLPALLALLLLSMQIALGGWVSTNYATLACTDFPLCQGTLLPHMDFENGFTLWRHLGKTAGGDYLAFPALVAIQWTHRSFAYIVIALVAFVAHKSLKIAELRATARWLLIVVALQFCTGAATVFFHWPLALAVAHNGGAALLAILLTMLNYKLRLSAASGVAQGDVSLAV